MVAMNELLDPKTIVTRYVSVWIEPDAAARRARIEEIWTTDGAHLSATKEARGFDQLENRITNTYNEWVVNEKCSFRPLGDEHMHHDAITFRWEMLSHTGEVESIGRDVVLIDETGRIRCVYQFIEQ